MAKCQRHHFTKIMAVARIRIVTKKEKSIRMEAIEPPFDMDDFKGDTVT